MAISGNLVKMKSEWQSNEEPVRYYLAFNRESIERTLCLNDYVGKTFKLHFTGQMNCIACHRALKKTYNQGYCFVCTQKLAQCDWCILKPELCHYHKGTCREPEWGMSHCMIPHVVYLANTAELKVGITRKTQIPTRWVDQGAVSALPMFEVPTRLVSGLIEVELANHISDKTNWRNMLKNHVKEINLYFEKERLFQEIQVQFKVLLDKYPDIIYLTDVIETKITYPVLEYPSKISSLSFDKTPTIEGTLLGVKGQYLIFDHGVINLRKHTGYFIECEN